MACGTALACGAGPTMLGHFAVLGGIIAIYAARRLDEKEWFYVSAGILPIAAAGIATTGILTECTANILNAGSAAILMLAVLGIAREEHHL